MKLYLTPEAYDWIHLDRQPTTARESILGALYLGGSGVGVPTWSRKGLLESWKNFAPGPFSMDLASMALDNLIEEGLVEER